jgi:hypothetical protein
MKIAELQFLRADRADIDAYCTKRFTYRVIVKVMVPQWLGPQ